MKVKYKSLKTILIALLTLAVALAAIGLFSGISRQKTAVADEQATTENIYYNQLKPTAKKFYDAIEEMNKQGLLKKGNAQYDLVANDVLSQVELQAFSKTQTTLESFGAARDAYYLAHPELFYVDFSYLTINVGKKGDTYVGTLGAGRSDSYYAEGFSSEAEVDAAVAEYETALKAITDKANAKQNTVEKIKSVNADLVNSIEYSFCDTPAEADKAPHIRSAYGALVKDTAVCEGFTRAFKAAMDVLGIRCVIVQGFASYEERLEPHAWNYVNVEDNWYGVDVTWNNDTRPETYLLRGKTLMDSEHIADGVVSAANFRFEYPLLSEKDYGVATSDEIQVEIDPQNDSVYKVSKDGKNSTELEQENLWLVLRYYYYEGNSYTWTNWVFIKTLLGGTSMSDGDGYTPTMINSNIMYTQFGLIGRAPDNQFGTYDQNNLKDSDLIVTSKYYENQEYSLSYGAPYIKETTPSHLSANLDATKTYDISITYTQNLKKADPNKEVELSYTTIKPDVKDYAEITDFQWDGKDTITFKFTPSAMYQHRDEVYSFVPTNLVGEDSEKEPIAVMYITKNNNVACNRMYPDGRLYVNTYGAPSLVGSGDLSMTDWTDEKGNKVGANQRSQLMLVATKTTEKEGNAMVDSLKDLPEGAVPEGAVQKAETFELEMNLCKNIVTIPKGSTVQLAFGFPAGYGPDDAGVTFKVYHFKRGEDGKIDYSKTEEIDCVITEYGLMVNVTDFSPFAVVALDSSKVATTKKSVYARSVGFGGSFEGDIAQLVGENDTVSYKLVPDENYKVEAVLLNGEKVEFTNNTVTLGYNDLKDRNNIEFRYVANSVAESEAAEGITPVYSGGQTWSGDEGSNPFDPPAIAPNDDGMKPAMIAIIVVLCVLVVAAIGVCTFLVIKGKKPKKN